MYLTLKESIGTNIHTLRERERESKRVRERERESERARERGKEGEREKKMRILWYNGISGVVCSTRCPRKT